MIFSWEFKKLNFDKRYQVTVSRSNEGKGLKKYGIFHREERGGQGVNIFFTPTCYHLQGLAQLIPCLFLLWLGGGAQWAKIKVHSTLIK